MEQRVVNWSLHLTFKRKEQRDVFLGFLLEDFPDCTIELSTENVGSSEQGYHVSILDFCWRHRLKEIGEFIDNTLENNYHTK